MSVKEIVISQTADKTEIRKRVLGFLIKHLGSRPDEVIPPEAQNEGFVENPFPFGLGDDELIQLGGMIDLKAHDVNDGKGKNKRK